MRNNIASRWPRALALVVLGALLAACGDGGATATTAGAEVELAPELVGLEEWINSEPLTLAQLRGEPVLIVFWASW
jgi:hypothetical protein